MTPSTWMQKDIAQLLTKSTYDSSLSGDKSALNELLACTRASVGWGLSLPVGPARLELTYALPLLKAPSDSVRQFQVGLGISIS